MDIFAYRLKQLRQSHNLTTKQAAEELRIHLTTLQSYELGITKPRIKIFCRIADFYKVSTNWLCGRE